MPYVTRALSSSAGRDKKPHNILYISFPWLHRAITSKISTRSYRASPRHPQHTRKAYISTRSRANANRACFLPPPPPPASRRARTFARYFGHRDEVPMRTRTQSQLLRRALFKNPTRIAACELRRTACSEILRNKSAPSHAANCIHNRRPKHTTPIVHGRTGEHTTGAGGVSTLGCDIRLAERLKQFIFHRDRGARTDVFAHSTSHTLL